MDGKTFATIIETELLKRGISKGEFYEAVGVTAAALLPISEIKCELLYIKSDIKKQKPHET